jgi:hypothetical protein
LLIKLHEANGDNQFDDQPDLLQWLLYTGGAFIPEGPTRSGYTSFVNRERASAFGGSYRSLTDVVQVLKQFIWSEKVFKVPIERFWKETSL